MFGRSDPPPGYGPRGTLPRGALGPPRGAPPQAAYPPPGAYPPRAAYPPPGAYPPRGAYPRPAPIPGALRTIREVTDALAVHKSPRILTFQRGPHRFAITLTTEKLGLLLSEEPHGLVLTGFGEYAPPPGTQPLYPGDLLLGIASGPRPAPGTLRSFDETLRALRDTPPPRRITFRRPDGSNYTVEMPNARLGINLAEDPTGCAVTGFGPEFSQPAGPNRIGVRDILVKIEPARRASRASPSGGAGAGAASPSGGRFIRDVNGAVELLTSIPAPRKITFRRATGSDVFSVLMTRHPMGIVLADSPHGVTISAFGDAFVQPDGPNKLRVGDIMVSIERPTSAAPGPGAASAPAATPLVLPATVPGHTPLPSTVPATAPAAASTSSSTPDGDRFAHAWSALKEKVLTAQDEAALLESLNAIEGFFRSAPPGAFVVDDAKKEYLAMGPLKKEESPEMWTSDVARAFGAGLKTLATRSS